MNHAFIVGLRSATNEILNITESTNKRLDILKYEYLDETEKAILNNSKIGKAYLISNIKEILIDGSFTYTKVGARILDLQGAGLDDYDLLYANTREVINNLEDAVSGLLNLLTTYFPEEDAFYEESSIKFRGYWDRVTEPASSANLSSLEIFTWKVRPNGVRYKTLDILIDSILKTVKSNLGSYISKIEKELTTFPHKSEEIVAVELDKLWLSSQAQHHDYLIFDEVLKDSLKFKESFTELAQAISHFDSATLTNICQLHVSRMLLLQKNNFLTTIKQQVENVEGDEKEVDHGLTNLKIKLTEHGFFNLTKVIEYGNDEPIVSLIYNGTASIKVATLKYFGFVDTLKGSPREIGKLLGSIIGRSADVVRNEINSFNKNSEVDRSRYRAGNELINIPNLLLQQNNIERT